MNRAGILVLLASLATTACTTRKSAGVSVIVGFGMLVGGGIAASTSDQDGNAVGAGVALFLTGAIVALASGIAVAAIGEEKPSVSPTDVAVLPPPPPPPPRKAPPPKFVVAPVWPEEMLRLRRVARHLARNGHCAQVRDISIQVEQRDATFHRQAFAIDAAVVPCLIAP
ncbi:MAG: hypothetical protein M4D80_40610 [Myxococcota bacterium]|nr:hypothetical protein [Deltaproteobacteria bacterium]MDQ3341498.1 hypothetical protein [Myxococcota bacterium]